MVGDAGWTLGGVEQRMTGVAEFARAMVFDWHPQRGLGKTEHDRTQGALALLLLLQYGSHMCMFCLGVGTGTGTGTGMYRSDLSVRKEGGDLPLGSSLYWLPPYLRLCI